ncbi:hypothetical protein J2W94_001832 [Pseudoxanthomonas sacheonensis]|uniref:Uncharacterized protein n=1 Tax=Pseudoxanthomonas sacheonensis TaxID=443615 RepID=A0ABU1RS04_9GAMM|nr:hypothetical protein [Pseudoxanthomonas sacheonensis]
MRFAAPTTSYELAVKQKGPASRGLSFFSGKGGTQPQVCGSSRTSSAHRRLNRTASILRISKARSLARNTSNSEAGAHVPCAPATKPCTQGAELQAQGYLLCAQGKLPCDSAFQPRPPGVGITFARLGARRASLSASRAKPFALRAELNVPRLTFRALRARIRALRTALVGFAARALRVADGLRPPDCRPSSHAHQAQPPPV